MEETARSDFPELNKEVKIIWNSIAEWWNDKIGEGNDFQDILIEPATERLLEIKPGDYILDIACGAGRFARRMAAAGAEVLAIDQSEKFIEIARERTGQNYGKIRYRVCDATDREALIALDKRKFDAAVCTMALMDMACIEPLISALPYLLKRKRHFVFSILHPAFNSGKTRRFAEDYIENGKVISNCGVMSMDYLKSFSYLGIGIRGQPVPQYYFHRPIGLLFNTFFRYGFKLDGIEEPALPAELSEKAETTVSWHCLNWIPPVLVARMRLID